MGSGFLCPICRASNSSDRRRCSMQWKVCRELVVFPCRHCRMKLDGGEIRVFCCMECMQVDLQNIMQPTNWVQVELQPFSFSLISHVETLLQNMEAIYESMPNVS
jgi:hypothetical protein